VRRPSGSVTHDRVSGSGPRWPWARWTPPPWPTLLTGSGCSSEGDHRWRPVGLELGLAVLMLTRLRRGASSCPSKDKRRGAALSAMASWSVRPRMAGEGGKRDVKRAPCAEERAIWSLYDNRACFIMATLIGGSPECFTAARPASTGGHRVLLAILYP